MNPIRRQFLKAMTAAAALPAVGSLTACGGSTSGKQTINFWAMGSEGEVVKKVLPKFYERYPNVEVKVQAIPWSTAHEKLLTSYVGETLPDIFQLGNTWIPEFAQLNVLEPLEPWIEKSTVIKADDYFQGVLNTNRIDKLYGLPWYIDTRLLFYRKDLLAKAGYNEPPTTWLQWGQMMESIRAQSTGGDFAFYLPINEFDPLLALGLQQNDTLLKNNNTQGNFNSPDFHRAISFYADIFKKGWSSLEGNAQVKNLIAEFGKGRFVFFMSGPWNVGELKKNLPAAQQNLWATAPMPGPDGLGASTAGGASLVLYKYGKQKELAWKLFEYLSESQTQIEFYKLTGDLPARRTAWMDGKLNEEAPMQAFLSQLDRVKPTPSVLEWERIAVRMQQVAESVVRTGQPIDAALIELDANVDDILAKRRWMQQKASAK